MTRKTSPTASVMLGARNCRVRRDDSMMPTPLSDRSALAGDGLT